MTAAYSATSFDQLSVGQPPPTSSTSKPETEVDSTLMFDDWRLVTSVRHGGGRRLLRGGRTAWRGGARRRRQAAESTSFVGMMQQLSVDGRELFELAERGHFDVVDSTATKDVSGGPITFTSPEAYLSLSADTQSVSFSIYFRVLMVIYHLHQVTLLYLPPTITKCTVKDVFRILAMGLPSSKIVVS